MKTTGIHEEFVLVIQGASSLYRFGSDRIYNADDFCWKHAEAMTDFIHPELHPEVCASYRNRAKKYLERKLRDTPDRKTETP